MIRKKPNQRAADDKLDQILSRVRYIGPKAAPTEDEIMDVVVKLVRRVRRRLAE
jgi:hypothetical protein